MDENVDGENKMHKYYNQFIRFGISIGYWKCMELESYMVALCIDRRPKCNINMLQHSEKKHTQTIKSISPGDT